MARRIARSTSAIASASRPVRRSRRRSISASRTPPRCARSETSTGSTRLAGHGREVGLDLLGHDRPRIAHVRLGRSSGRHRRQGGQVDPGHARQVADLGLHVMRQGQVEHDEGVVRPARVARAARAISRSMTLSWAPVQQMARSTSARAAGRSRQVDRAATGDPGRDALGDGRRPVGHHHIAGSARDQGGGGQGSHRPGADDEDPALAEVTEDVRGGVEGDGHDRDTGTVDAGLGMDPLADAQRPLADAVEHPPAVPLSWPRTRVART